MNPSTEPTNLLNLQVRLAANPTITFLKEAGSPLQRGAAPARPGFDTELELEMPYTQASLLLAAYLRGTRLEIVEGFLKQHIVLDGCRLQGEQGQLVVTVSFSGSYEGTAAFKGTPFYDAAQQTIGLQHMSYDLDTRNVLLKGLKWLFQDFLLNAIKKYSAVSLAAHKQKAADEITKLLNNEWANGVQAAGTVTTLDVTTLAAAENGLLIGVRCGGELHLTIAPLQLAL